MALTYRQELALEQVRIFMELNKFSIIALVSRSNISKEKLTRGFKELYGQTVYSYQLSISMKDAKKLLEDGIELKVAGFAGE